MCTMIGPRAMQVLLVCVTLVVLSPLAQADKLSAGQTGTPDMLPAAGTVVASIAPTPISASTCTGLYQTTVFSDPSNVLCSGCLDFTYRFTNNGPDDVQRLTMANFFGVMVDVGWNPVSTGATPVEVERSANGATIGFSFTGTNEIDPGARTVQLVIQTDVKEKTDGVITFQDGSVTSAHAFAPVTVIPEPSSLALLGGGVLIFTQVHRRKLL